MLRAEQKLIRAAMSFGAWRERAESPKLKTDRKKFIRAELTLLLAAQELFEAQKGRSGDKKGRSES
jgi:hypothetical protein